MAKLRNIAFLILCFGAAFTFSSTATAQLSIPLSGGAPPRDEQPKQPANMRTLSGVVVDGSEKPVSGAVVYRKNTKTLEVKSYITDDKGSFRFTGLSQSVDFEVYAEFKGKRTQTKTLSTFDSRKEVQITLKLDK